MTYEAFSRQEHARGGEGEIGGTAWCELAEMPQMCESSVPAKQSREPNCRRNFVSFPYRRAAAEIAAARHGSRVMEQDSLVAV